MCRICELGMGKVNFDLYIKGPGMPSHNLEPNHYAIIQGLLSQEITTPV